jgi:hypothetical protein
MTATPSATARCRVSTCGGVSASRRVPARGGVPASGRVLTLRGVPALTTLGCMPALGCVPALGRMPALCGVSALRCMTTSTFCGGRVGRGFAASGFVLLLLRGSASRSNCRHRD